MYFAKISFLYSMRTVLFHHIICGWAYFETILGADTPMFRCLKTDLEKGLVSFNKPVCFDVPYVNKTHLGISCFLQELIFRLNTYLLS